MDKEKFSVDFVTCVVVLAFTLRNFLVRKQLFPVMLTRVERVEHAIAFFFFF